MKLSGSPVVELKWGDLGALRDAYAAHVEAVDGWVGRLMNEVPEDVLVFMLGDIGMALGEHDYLGRGAPTSHRESYEIPYLIRHPQGELAGDDVDWYASTHDVAPTLLSHMGLIIPGKMWGEDLTALFDDVDEDDLYDRPFSITASGSQIIVRDKRFLMVADREQIERRMYDDDEEVEDDIKRYDNIANEDLEYSRAWFPNRRSPSSAPTAPCARPSSAATTTPTTTASRTTSTPSTTTSARTAWSRRTSSSTAATRRIARWRAGRCRDGGGHPQEPRPGVPLRP